MSAHVKGPWRVAGVNDGSVLITNGVEVVGRAEGWNRATDEANARLIASAPDLLAALKALVEDDLHAPKHLAAAHAAILKAEGPPNPETTPHDVDACKDQPCPACYDDRIAAAEALADSLEDR